MAIPTFPTLPGIEWPLKRSTIWKTLKQESQSGKTTRLAAYTFPRYQWTVSFAALRVAAGLAEFQTFIGFINSLNGGALPFYYVDDNDNAVSGQLFGIGDGTTKAFQLVRALGGFSEPMQSIVGTPTVTVAGAATTAFTVSNVGVLTFTAAPAAGAVLAWSGSFQWLCSMDKDTTEFSEFVAGIYSVGTISFTSIKL